MVIFFACICLKVSANGSLYCIFTLFYSIFSFKSFLKGVILRKKEGRALIGGGALNGKKYGNIDKNVFLISEIFSDQNHFEEVL